LSSQDEQHRYACGDFATCPIATATDLPKIHGATRCERQRIKKEKVMRELVAMASACAVLGVVAVSSTASPAAEGNDMATAVEAANPLWQVAHRRHYRRGTVRPGYESVAPYGCYRLGETGYHWYNFCLGPSWLYPHQRVCRHGYCWYR
jgi:hypothetical protein